jgi:histidyl-tRNA synthetase
MSVASSMRGFPEWLPDGQLVEQRVLATLRRTFELHGFTPLDTRSVEPLETLLEKGETDKEIYVLRRLQAEPGEPSSGLGLHFDLTVPFARYVRENAGKLIFPWKRYQVQKAWRGERPQEGRYREFLQADVDVVGRGELAAHFEAELPLVAADALRRLPIPAVTIQVNSRKIVDAAFGEVGIEDRTAAFRAVDKLRKIGPEAVRALLVEAGASAAQAEVCLRLCSIRSTDLSFVDEVLALGVRSDLLDEGLADLSAVLEAGRLLGEGATPFVADLQITRGLDYYTGTVYESVMDGLESIGSVCSGGRYDNLVGGAGDEAYPGVGLSIGVTRILGPLLSKGRLRASRSVPTCVLVAVADEGHRPVSDRIASALRSRGIPAEVSPTAARYGRQIRHADERGIPFVWFPAGAGPEGGERSEVRDIRTGDQVPADEHEWSPPTEDLEVTIWGE